MSVIVHIGYHKTGTTWFQKRFYPHVTSHRYIRRERVRHAFMEDGAFSFDPGAALERLGAGADENIILCEEGLSGYLHNGGMAGHFSAAMAERIHAVFPHAQIVVFIRSQPEIIASAYQQYIRGGGTHPPKRYLFPDLYLHGAAAEAHKVPRFSFDHFDYLPLIETYGRLFGREHVHLFTFEELGRDRLATLERFRSRLELEVGSGPAREKRENSSYARPLVFLARILNHFTYRTVADKRYLLHIPYWYTARRTLLEALNRTGAFGKTPSPESLLGKKIVAWIRQRYWQGNAALADLYALPLRELGYPVSPPDAAVERPAANRAAAWTKE